MSTSPSPSSQAQEQLDLALRAGVLAQAAEVRAAAERAIPVLQELEQHPDPKVSRAAHEIGRVLRALAGQAALGELVKAPSPGPWWRRWRRWWR